MPAALLQVLHEHFLLFLMFLQVFVETLMLTDPAWLCPLTCGVSTSFLFVSTGTLLRALHQTQRCQVPSHLRAGTLPPPGGVPGTAGERQGPKGRLRLQADVSTLPPEVLLTLVFFMSGMQVNYITLLPCFLIHIKTIYIYKILSQNIW